MKNLKILLLLFVGTLFLTTSCGGDDTTTPITTDEPIVGEWMPIQTIIACSTGVEYPEASTVCEQNGRIIFSNDGTLVSTEYYEENNDCITDGTDAGTWEIINDVLSVTIDGETFEVGFFELEGDTLKIGEYDNSFVCGTNGELTSHFYYEYTRVQ